MVEPKSKSKNTLKINRSDIIREVQTPLGFFALVVLVVEIIFGIICGISEGSHRTYLIWGMLILIFLLVGIVFLMAIWKPESLKGKRAPAPNLLSPSEKLNISEVIHINNPKILCASTTQFEKLGFESDVEAVKESFSNVKIEHGLTSDKFKALMSGTNKYDIIHLLANALPNDGLLIFEENDSISPLGFASLIELSGAKLVILATCDSIDLAARVSRTTNMIAATTVLESAEFIKWAKFFYNLLSQGHSLSRAFDISRTVASSQMVLLLKQDITFSK